MTKSCFRATSLWCGNVHSWSSSSVRSKTMDQEFRIDAAFAKASRSTSFCIVAQCWCADPHFCGRASVPCKEIKCIKNEAQTPQVCKP